MAFIQQNAGTKKGNGQINNYINPFEADVLNDRYHYAVATLVKKGGTDYTQIVKDAYEATMRYGQTAVQSRGVGVNDAMKNLQVAQAEMDDFLKLTGYGYSVQGKTEDQLTAMYNEKILAPRQQNAQQRLQAYMPYAQQNSARNDEISFYTNLSPIIEKEIWGEQLTDSERNYLDAFVEGLDDTSYNKYWDYGYTERRGGEGSQAYRDYFTQMGNTKAQALQAELDAENAKMEGQARDLLTQADVYMHLPDRLLRLAVALKTGGEVDLIDAEEAIMQNVISSLSPEAYEIYRQALLNGELTDDQWDFLDQFGKEKAAKMDLAGKYVPLWQMGEYETWLDDYYKRNTMQGAQAWRDAEPDNEEANRNLWFLERKKKYSMIPQAEDFAERSKAMQGQNRNIGIDEIVKYDYINDLNGQRERAGLAASMSGIADPYLVYSYMTPEEVAKYNYLYSENDGGKQANEYLDYLLYDLNKRKNTAIAQNLYDYVGESGENAVFGSAASVVSSIGRGMGYLDVLIQRLFNGDKPIDYERMAEYGIATDAIRQGVMDSADWKINIGGKEYDAFDFLYSTGMSWADSMSAGAMFGPTGAGAALGLSAAESTFRSAREKGADVDKALIASTFAGAFEGLFEKWSIGELQGAAKAVGKQNFWKNLGWQFFVNADEELNTDLANMLFDNFIMGDLSDYNLAVEEYKRLGMDAKEAEARARQDIYLQLAETALGGGLMGGGSAVYSSSISAANTAYSNKQAGSAITSHDANQVLHDIGIALGEDTEAGKLAKKYDPKNATNRQTGRLYRAVINALPQQMRAPLNERIMMDIDQKLQELGEGANRQQIADAVRAMFAGEDISEEQFQAIAQSENGLEVVKDLMGVNETETETETKTEEKKAEEDYPPWEDAPEQPLRGAEAQENAPIVEKAQQPERDPAIEQYAKENGMDYEAAKAQAEAAGGIENVMSRYEAEAIVAGWTKKQLNSALDKQKKTQAALDAKNEEYNQALTDLETANKNIQTLENTISGMEKDLEDLDAQLANQEALSEQELQKVQADKAAIESELAIAQASLDGMTAERNELAGRVTTLEGEKTALQAKYDEEVASHNQTKADLDTMTAKLDEMTTKQEETQTELNKKDADLKVTQTALNRANSTVKANRVTIEAIRKEQERLQAKLADQEALSEQERQEAQAEIDSLQSDLAIAETALATSEQEYADLEEKFNTLQTDRNNLEAQLNTLQTEKDALEGQIAALQNDKAELEGQNAALQNDKAALEGQIAANQEEQNRLQAQLDEQKAMTEAAVAEANAAKNELEKIKAESKPVPEYRMDEDGNIFVHENGKAVPLEESSLPEDEKTIIRETMEEDRAFTQAVMDAFRTGATKGNKADNATEATGEAEQTADERTQDAQSFARGFKRAVEWVKAGKNLWDLASPYVAELSEYGKNLAIQYGETLRQEEMRKQEQANIQQAHDNGFQTLQENGEKVGVSFAKVTKEIGETAKTQLQLIDMFAKKYGLRVHVYDSLNDGNANGIFKKATNQINLALDAEGGLLTRTVSHESFHFIESWNEGAAKKLQDFVVKTLQGKEGYDLQKAIQDKIQQYKDNGEKLDEPAAIREIVADSLLDVIGTEENIRQLLKQDRTLVEKISEGLKKIVADLKAMMQRLSESSAEVKALQGDMDYYSNILQMVDEALTGAKENYAAAQYKSAAVMQDSAVQEYLSEMKGAATQEDTQAALNGMISNLFTRAEKGWMEKNPDVNLNESLQKFADALKSYQRGEMALENALKREGFDAQPYEMNTVLSYAGQQLLQAEARGQDGDVQYSFQGVDENTGLKIYRVDFGLALSKTEKQAVLVDIIRHAWAKKPITLTIDDDGVKRQITAQFDPDFDPTGNRQTDIGKMVYGNRMGNSKDRRITLGLSGDMYQIISDSSYLTSEAESGKQRDTHTGVKQWHYFATDIIAEEMTGEKEPYTVFIDVKEKNSGSFVYTYYALNEKKSAKLRSSVPAAHRGNTEVNSDKAIAATAGALGITGPSELKHASVNSYIAENSDSVKAEKALNQNGIELLDDDTTTMQYSFKKSDIAQSNVDISEDAELFAQVNMDKDAETALQMVQKLYAMTVGGKGYLGEETGKRQIEKGAWKTRLDELVQRLKTETGSTYSDRYIKKSLSNLFAAMDSGASLSDIIMYARDLGKRMLFKAPGMIQEKNPEITEAVRILKDRHFFLTDDMKSAIREKYGSLKAYQQKNFGRLGIRNKATSNQRGAQVNLAEVWQELSELMPGTFAADAVEADMPEIADAFLDTAGKKDFGGAYGKNIGAYATDLGLSMMLEYFSLPGAITKESQLRKQFEHQLQEMRTNERLKYEERIADRRKREEMQKARDGVIREISGDVKYLNARIVRESNAMHVPEEMKGAVIDAIKPFLNDTSVFDYRMLMKLREAYEAMMETGVNAETQAARSADGDILNAIKTMEKTIAGRRLSQLTLEELQSVRDVMGNLKKMVTEANEMLVNGRKEAADAIGNEGMVEMAGKKDVKMEKTQNLSYKNTTPIYFFRRIGGVFQRLYEDIREGQNTWAKNMRYAREFADAQAEKYRINEWLKGNETFRFTSERGEEIELSKGLALSIYCTWKREVTNTAQNANHLRMGGFKYPEGTKAYKGVDMRRAHALSSMDVMKIQQFLGKEAIEFADAMVGYLSNEMAAIGNEVSMELYGYRKFTEKYYFPYESSRDFINQDLTKENFEMADASGALKGWGAAKKLTTKANNPIVIHDFFETWANHVNKMCIYGAFTVATDNMNRIYNYKTPVDSDMTATSIKEEMNRVYGTGAAKYMATLVRDIAGGMRAQDRTKMGKMISRFKKGATAANLQVVVQQPSSIARVMAVMNPRYLMGAVATKKNIEEMRKHSGIATIKEMGRFDTGTGLSATQWLTESIRDEKLMDRAVGKMDKATGYLAEKGDLLTWGTIWHAVKREINHTMPELQIGSEEYFNVVAKRFNDVIDLTQVYDSTLSKSELMRSNSAFDKMATSFMSEPTVTYNMLQDAIVHAKDMGGKKKLLRATSVWVSAALFNAMLKSLISAMRRKDDEERTYIEKYLAEVWGNFSGDMNPAGMIPIARDIVSLFEGYDVNRADMEIYAQMVDAIETLENENKSFYDKAKAITGATGNMLGIPAGNVWRDAEGILNIFRSAPIGETSIRDIKYSVLDETAPILGKFDIWDESAKGYYGRITDAMENGNEEKAEELRGYMQETEGKSESTVNKGIKEQIKTRLIRGEMDEATAMDLLEELGMDADDAYFQVEEWMETARSGNPDYSYSKYNDFDVAVKTGVGLKAAINELTSHGSDKSDLAGRITSQNKAEYIRLYKTNKAAFANLQARLLTAYEMLGYSREQKLKDMQKWLK